MIYIQITNSDDLKRLIAIIFAVTLFSFFFLSICFGLYFWIDENGVKHFSNTATSDQIGSTPRSFKTYNNQPDDNSPNLQKDVKNDKSQNNVSSKIYEARQSIIDTFNEYDNFLVRGYEKVKECNYVAHDPNSIKITTPKAAYIIPLPGLRVKKSFKKIKGGGLAIRLLFRGNGIAEEVFSKGITIFRSSVEILCPEGRYLYQEDQLDIFIEKINFLGRKSGGRKISK